MNGTTGDTLGLGSATFGKYELVGCLGSATTAGVFLAVGPGKKVGGEDFRSLVVIKRLVANDDDAITGSFLDEARIAALLDHPNLVKTYEVGALDGADFIAMEYLEGQPLDKILRHPKARETFHVRMWCHVFAQALTGLHHAHARTDDDGVPLGIVHRDLSPDNVFVTYSGEVKLFDFGMAKASLNTTSTEVGTVKGQLNYMSPEHLTVVPRGGRWLLAGDTDARADVFALGLCLWEALAGRPVFRGDASTVLRRILHDAIPKLSEVRPDVEPELEGIVMKSVAKDREDRYQTADAFRLALVAFAGHPSDEAARDAIGTAVSTLFRDTKDDVRRRIDEHVQALSLPKTTAVAARLKAPSLIEGVRAAAPDYSFLENLSEPRPSLPGSAEVPFLLASASETVRPEAPAPHAPSSSVAIHRKIDITVPLVLGGLAFLVALGVVLWMTLQR